MFYSITGRVVRTEDIRRIAGAVIIAFRRRLDICRKKIKNSPQNLLTTGALFGTMLLAFGSWRGANNMAA